MAEPGGAGYPIQDVVAYPLGLLSQIRRQCTHNDATRNDFIILEALHEKFNDHPLRLSIVRRLGSILTELTARLTDKIELLQSTQVNMAEYLRMDMEPELENILAKLATKMVSFGREMDILQSIRARATEFEMAFEAETGSARYTQNEQPETDATGAAPKQQRSIIAPSLTQVADASFEATKGILGIQSTRIVAGDEDPQAVQEQTDDPSQGGPETAGDTTTSKGGDGDKASIKATEAVRGTTPFTPEIVASDEEAQLTHDEAEIPPRAAAETVESTTTSRKGDDDDEILHVGNPQPEQSGTRGEGNEGGARNDKDHDGVVQDFDHDPEDGEHTKIGSPEEKVDPLSSAIEESTKPEPGQIQPWLYDAEFALELSKASRRSRRANAEVLRRNDAALTIATASAKLREIAAEANEASDEPEEGGEGQREGARFTFDKSLSTVGPGTPAPLTGALQTALSEEDAKNHQSAFPDDVLADPAPTHGFSFAGKHEEEDFSIYEDPPPEEGDAANVRELETTVTITDRSDVCDQEVRTGPAVSFRPSSSRDASDASHRSPSASPEDTSALSSPVSELADPFDQLQRTTQIEANDGTAVTDQRPTVTNKTEIARQKCIMRIEQNWNRSINDVLQHPVWPNRNGRLGRNFLYNLAQLSDMNNNFEDAMAMLERDVFDQQNTQPHKWQRNHVTTLTIKRVIRSQAPTKHIPLNTWHSESGGGSAAKEASAGHIDTTVAAESSLQTQKTSEAEGRHVSNSADVQPPEDTLSAIALKLRAIPQSQLYLDAMAMLSQNKEDVSRHGLGYVIAEWAKAIFENDKALCFQRVDAISDVLAMVIRHRKRPLEERWVAVQVMDQEIMKFLCNRDGLGVIDTNRKVMPMVFGEMRRAWASKQSPALRCVENMLAANPRPEKRGSVEEAIAFAVHHLRSVTASSLNRPEAAAYDLFEAILANDRARHNQKVKQSALSSLLEAEHRAHQAAHREVASTAEDANNSSKGGENLHAEQRCAVSDEVEATVAEATPKPARSPVIPRVVSAPRPSDHESEEEDREKEGSPPGSEVTEKRNVVDTLLEDARDRETGSTRGASNELPQIVESEDVSDYSQSFIDLEAHAPPQETATHKCDFITNNGQRCNALMSSAQLLLAHLNTVHNMPKDDVWCDVCLGGKIFCRTDALWRHMRDVHHDVSPAPPTSTTTAVHGMDTAISFNPQDPDAGSSNNGMATPSFNIRLTILEEEDVKQIVAEMLKRPVNAPNYAVEVGLAVMNGRGNTIAGLKAVSKGLKAGINKYVVDPSMREKTLSALEQAVREHMRAKGLVDIALRNPALTTEQAQASHESSTVQTTEEVAATGPSTGPGETHLAPTMGDNLMATTAARPSTCNSSGIDPNELAADILAVNADPRERGATYAPFEIAMRYFQARRPDTTATLEMIASELLHCIPNAAKQLYPSRARDCALEAVRNAKAAYIGKMDLEAKVPLLGHSVTARSAAPVPAERSILSSDLPPATKSPPAALPSLDQENSNPDDVAARILTARDATNMALQYLNSRKPEAVAVLETIAFEWCQCITKAAKQLPQENKRKREACAHDALEAAMDIYIEQNNLESRDFPAGSSSQLAQAPAPVPEERPISNSTLSPTRTASDVAPSCLSDHDAAKSRETLLEFARPLTSSNASSVLAGVAPSGRSKSYVRKSDHTLAAAGATVEKSNTCAAKHPSFTRAQEQSTAPDRLLDLTTKRDTEQLGTTIPEHTLEDVSGATQRLQLEKTVQPRKRRTEPRKKMAAPRTSRSRDVNMVTQVQPSDSVKDVPDASLSLASEKCLNDSHDIPPTPPQEIEKNLLPVTPAPHSLPPRPPKVWDGSSFVVTVDPVLTASQNNSTARSASQPLSPQPPSSGCIEQTPPAPSAVSPGFYCPRYRPLRPAAAFHIKNNGSRNTTCCSATSRNHETDTEAVTPGRKHRHISPGITSSNDRDDLDNHPDSNSNTSAKSDNFSFNNRAYFPTKPGNPSVDTREKGAELAPIHNQVRVREERPETAAGTPHTTSASQKRTRGIDTEAPPTSPIKPYLPAPSQRSSSDIAGAESIDVTVPWMRDEREIVQANKLYLAGLKAYGEIYSVTSSNDSASQTQLPDHELTDTPTTPDESLNNARVATLKRQEADAAERRRENACIKASEMLLSGVQAKNAATGTSSMASTSHSRDQRAEDEPTLASPTHVEPTPAPVPTPSSTYHSHFIPQRTVTSCGPLAPKRSQKKQNDNAAQVNSASSKQPPRCHTTSNEVAAAAKSGFSVHGAPSDTVSNANAVSPNSSISLEPSHPYIINPQAFTQHAVPPNPTIWIGPPRPQRQETNLKERKATPHYVSYGEGIIEDYEPIPPNLNIEPPSRTPSPVIPIPPNNIFTNPYFHFAEPSVQVTEMLAPVRQWDQQESRKRRRFREFEERGEVKDELLVLGSEDEDEDVWLDVREPKKVRYTHGVGVGAGVGP